MSSEEQEMTQEDRLKAIAYQFIALYERWSEDRQMAAKQGADFAEMVKLFSEQVEEFQTLEAKVRDQIIRSIHQATAQTVKTVSENIGKEATREVENTVRRLSNSVDSACLTLNSYQRETLTTQWKVIGASVVTTIVACVFIFWLVMPRPTLPLTNEQVKFLESGIMLDRVWPKLSKSEKDRLVKLSDEVNHPTTSNDDNN